MSDMNDSTRRYLEYVAQHGSAIGAQEALGEAIWDSIDNGLVAKLLGTPIPNWYGDMLGKEGAQVIFPADHVVVQERYWSGGSSADRDAVPGVDVLVDGSEIEIGVAASRLKALKIKISFEETERLIKTLQAALIKALQWDSQEKQRGNR